MLELARALSADCLTTFCLFHEGGGSREFQARAQEAGFRSELSARLKELGADVLFCHGYKANLVGRWAARRAGIPVVAVSRGWTGESRKVRLYEAFDRLVLRGMDRVVCVSGAQAAKVWQAGISAERVVVIANAVRDCRFKADPAARGELEGLFQRPPRRLVAAAGRLSPEKGFATLVEAAARIEDRSIGFVLFGEGMLRPDLERQIDRLGLRERFILAGHRTDLDRLLPALDLLVLPSFTEGMPNVVLEALAAGVPVVATKVGGTPEVLTGSCGRLVPPGDPAALAVGVLDVLMDEARRRRMGQRGQERVRKHFTFDTQAEHYLGLLKELVKDASATPGQRTMAEVA
jgi:glycosyltransferase involved in cell wall biosynthesis